MPAIRVITAADIPAAMRLSVAAGWNQTATDWSNLMHLAPAGCFGIECDGMLVATATAACFGRELAWIGMVLTHADYRGRGFARALMEHALAYLDEAQVAWVKLDATDMGRPLYARLGFEDECTIERWGRAPAAAVPAAARYPPVTAYPAQDRAAFGADRRALLDVLAPIESATAPHGYAMGRPGTKAAYFGPCVAETPQAARDLVAWFVSRHAHESIYWDVLPDQREAVVLAREFGFQPLRKLVRMARKGRKPFAHDDRRIYAIAGFEYG